MVGIRNWLYLLTIGRKVTNMNQRIRELAKCNERIQNFFVTGAVQRAAIEQFAELIVRECIDIADEYDGAGSTIVSRIKKHFGVEE